MDSSLIQSVRKQSQKGQKSYPEEQESRIRTGESGIKLRKKLRKKNTDAHQVKIKIPLISTSSLRKSLNEFKLKKIDELLFLRNIYYT